MALARKVKILFLVSNTHFTDQRMQRICTSLQNANFDCTVLSLKGNNKINENLYPILSVNCFFKNGILFYFELFVKQLFKGYQTKFDIVSTVDADTALAGAFLARLKGKKHVHDFHELFSEVPELKGKTVKKRIWKWVESFSLKGKKSYTVAPGLANYYARVTNVRPFVFPNYPVLKPIKEQEKIYDIIYQGAINNGRCLKLLAEVCISNNYNLCICGKGDLDSQLKNWIKGADNITWKGEVTPAELHEITQQAKLGYNVLDNSSLSYDESMPNKTFDYIMAGLPQVISNSKRLVELNNMHSFSFVLDELNHQSLEALLVNIFAKPEDYEKLRTNCVQLRNKWNWQAIEPQLIEFYNKIEG